MKPIDVGFVLRQVARVAGLAPEKLAGLSQFPYICHWRDVAIYLARKMCGASYPELGRAFGRHHSTVWAAVKRVEHRIGGDRKNREAIESLEQRIAAAAETEQILRGGRPETLRRIGEFLIDLAKAQESIAS